MQQAMPIRRDNFIMQPSLLVQQPWLMLIRFMMMFMLLNILPMVLYYGQRVEEGYFMTVPIPYPLMPWGMFM